MFNFGYGDNNASLRAEFTRNGKKISHPKNFIGMMPQYILNIGVDFRILCFKIGLLGYWF
jgi:hypothetical protein